MTTDEVREALARHLRVAVREESDSDGEGGRSVRLCVDLVWHEDGREDLVLDSDSVLTERT